jgi:hypothetical protein
MGLGKDHGGVQMNTQDNPICCGELMGLIYSYTKNGGLVKVFQCDSCFGIKEEEGLMADFFTEEKQ